MTHLCGGALLVFSQLAISETTTFESPLVTGSPTRRPLWSGFGSVVLSYSEGQVQDVVSGAGLQALEISTNSGISWSSQKEGLPESSAESSLLVRHESFSTAAPEIPDEELSAVLFINNSGLLTLDRNTSGGGDWQILKPLLVDTFYEIRILRD